MSYRCSNFKCRARYKVVRWGQKRRYRARTGSGKYPQKKWTEEEIALVLKHAMTDRELAKQLHRSVASIQQKRHNIIAGIQAV